MPPKRENKATPKQQVEELKQQTRETKEAAEPTDELEQAIRKRDALKEPEKKLKRELRLLKMKTEEELTAATAELSLALDRGKDQEGDHDDEVNGECHPIETATTKGDSSHCADSAAHGKRALSDGATPEMSRLINELEDLCEQ